MTAWKVSFRPLTGTLLSKLYPIYNPIDGYWVSVPSRGLSYLNKKMDYHIIQ